MEYNSNQSYFDKRSAGMAVASLVIGICGAVLGLCPYGGFILGSLAIILGLLSRGGEMTMTGQAKAGVILGCVGIALSTIMIIITIAFGTFHFFNSQKYTNYNHHFYDNFYDDDEYFYDNNYFDDDKYFYDDYDFNDTF